MWLIVSESLHDNGVMTIAWDLFFIRTIMGGHALKNVSTRRYTLTEYFLLKERILNKLQGHLMFHVKIRSSILTFFSLFVHIRTLINELFHPTCLFIWCWTISNRFYFSRFDNALVLFLLFRLRRFNWKYLSENWFKIWHSKSLDECTRSRRWSNNNINYRPMSSFS